MTARDPQSVLPYFPLSQPVDAPPFSVFLVPIYVPDPHDRVPVRLATDDDSSWGE
jgi:hypothetical protein